MKNKAWNVKKTARRTPRNYDGIKPTSHHIADLLPDVFSKINKSYEDHPDLIMAFWPNIIGSKMAPMTEAVSFYDGVLAVKVKNSTLLSLLNQTEKPKLLAILRKKFPKVKITNIVFRIG